MLQDILSITARIERENQTRRKSRASHHGHPKAYALISFLLLFLDTFTQPVFIIEFHKYQLLSGTQYTC